ncbi:hypothetical protein L226DRAFT_268273 [Lentinus tigrinus ALCF2SS1-7]|uniref:uncharacterized protein n=1 Tax=Lentinus tigrinus ALCF2SS1-7 TaxID=1328758 RepID=UPI00116630C4|nr:hypothetical protein L226DRAFT_268273 [Lentinus tigrinus ALCF2SS1-7]
MLAEKVRAQDVSKCRCNADGMKHRLKVQVLIHVPIYCHYRQGKRRTREMRGTQSRAQEHMHGRDSTMRCGAGDYVR